MKYHNSFWPDENEFIHIMAPFIGGTILGSLLGEKFMPIDHGIVVGMVLGSMLGLMVGTRSLRRLRKNDYAKRRPLVLVIKGRLVEFEKNEIASLDVDPQNGFTPLCPDELPVTEGDQIVPELNAQAKFASIRTCSKDAHNPNAYHIASAENPQFKPITNFPNLDMFWSRHCQSGTYGGRLIEGLPPILSYDFVVYKGIESDLHPYGACFHDTSRQLSTGLIEFYRQRGIQAVIVGGLATDYCVRETVLQLRAAKFVVIINMAACRGVASETSEAALQEMARAGAILVSNAKTIESLIYKG